jgi:hypothetical protein
MTLLQCIATGSGIAIGFKIMNGIGDALIGYIKGTLHGKYTEIFPCPACNMKGPCGCYFCPLPQCKVMYQSTIPSPPPS